MPKSKKRIIKKEKRKTFKKWMGGRPPPSKVKSHIKSHSIMSKPSLNKSETALYVEQSKFKIVDVTPTIDLYTSGLATCSGLSILIGNKKFMAHLNPKIEQHSIARMVIAIQTEITNQNIDVNTLYATIYAGKLDSSRTLPKAMEICERIGIPINNVQIKNVCFMHEFGI
jgi:hypothetical protein